MSGWLYPAAVLAVCASLFYAMSAPQRPCPPYWQCVGPAGNHPKCDCWEQR